MSAFVGCMGGGAVRGRRRRDRGVLVPRRGFFALGSEGWEVGGEGEAGGAFELLGYGLGIDELYGK